MKYSIRMRASKDKLHEDGGQHISGAERIVDAKQLAQMAYDMVYRALHHSKGQADFIRLSIDTLQHTPIHEVPSLKIKTYEASNITDGLQQAIQLLEKHGVSTVAANTAVQFLQQLPTNMRGAALVDAQTGERIDALQMRGVRVSHMDYADEKSINKFMEKCGFHDIHVREALALASKVLSCKYIIAELCWSDDPDYITGYVSYDNIYHRITKMKELHSPNGGRVFFVNLPTDCTNNTIERSKIVAEIQNYLEKENVLIHLED